MRSQQYVMGVFLTVALGATGLEAQQGRQMRYRLTPAFRTRRGAATIRPATVSDSGRAIGRDSDHDRSIGFDWVRLALASEPSRTLWISGIQPFDPPAGPALHVENAIVQAVRPAEPELDAVGLETEASPERRARDGSLAEA